MTNTKLTRVFALAILFTLIIPLFLMGFTYQSNVNHYEEPINNSTLKNQSFAKEDYNPLIQYSDDHDLGNISVNDMTFSGLEMGFHLNNDKYPKLANDYNEIALNMTFIKMEFVETIKPAIYDKVLPVINDDSTITVKLNETLEIMYNTTHPPSEGYLIYFPRVFPCEFIELHVMKEGATEVSEVNEGNYSVDENGFLVFYYREYFEESIINFTLHVIWQYTFFIEDWELVQVPDTYIFISEQNQNFEILFNYNTNIEGRIIKGDNYSTGVIDLADGIEVNLTLELPDKDLLTYDTLIVNFIKVSDFSNGDNLINTGFMKLNQSQLILNFTAEFCIGFVNPVGKFWSIDRLVSESNIRERIYFLNITSGPEGISLNWITIFEKTINKDQVKVGSCLFEGRNVLTQKANASEWEEEVIYISSNPREREGINITLNYFIKNEICPITIRYEATEDLKIRLFDNIGMALISLEVTIYYNGSPYGTYISKNHTQPLSSQTTDINGEFIIYNVPNGQYTIHIYQYGIYQGAYKVNSYEEVNYITTTIIHFPLWILIFGIINLSVFALGYIYYRNNKKRQ